LLIFILEMKRIGIILVFCTLWATNGFAVSRSAVSSGSVRNGTTTQRARTTVAPQKKTVRVAVPQNKTVSRAATNVKSRGTGTLNRVASVARAAVAERTDNETRTGAEYEKCKTAYFTCMDQFCQLKNDNYRRCSCSDRIVSLQDAQNSLQQASEQLNAFNENLDIVGKTAAQAVAMNTASEGELAMGKDNSASKALLNAILNSIRGTDSRVENNKLSELNSVDLSFDAANSFGTTDVGQVIASYNGQALYSAVYPQCRNAVQSSCNNASLQRAVNAYLMAIEQDCNTVQTAINNKQKETHAAIRESSALLDLARAENHKNHNADDIATCLTNVEAAILSEEVCGANYHKCLDNGEYIDVTTGAPIAGVVDFYKLGTLLSFNSGRGNANQKLAQNPNNQSFVSAFEKRVKQFAEPALDKCVDDADVVWADYLNRALLDIYYAQQSKVNEIKHGCFDFVSACYMNGSTAMTDAMQGLVAAQTTTLNPNVLELNKSLCADYIASCNNMFNGQIIADYIDNRHDTDSLTACRAVVKQCFDNYGGLNYENFYYPSSGLFETGFAPDWFSLYECQDEDCNEDHRTLKSECAKQLAAIDACSDPDMIEKAFGGFDKYPTQAGGPIYQRYAYKADGTQKKQVRLLRSSGVATEVYNQIMDILQIQCSNLDGKFMNVQNLALDMYSASYDPQEYCKATFHNNNSRYNSLYELYSVGKSYTVFDYAYFDSDPFGIQQQGQPAVIQSQSWRRQSVAQEHDNENVCPKDYAKNVDVQSWGACLCWENGGRRSNNGTSTRCTPSFPVRPVINYSILAVDNDNDIIKQITTYGLNTSCATQFKTSITADSNNSQDKIIDQTPFVKWPYSTKSIQDVPTEQDWCTADTDEYNRVCPFGVSVTSAKVCNECPFDWEIPSNAQSSGKCCPKNRKLAGTICCPSATDMTMTNTNTGEIICRNSNGQDKTGVEAVPISSSIMNDDFPKNVEDNSGQSTNP